MKNSLPALHNGAEVDELQKRIAALGTGTCKTKIQQSPIPANGNIAICQTEITTKGMSVSMPGFATPETSKTEQTHILLADAAVSFMKMVLQGFSGRSKDLSQRHSHGKQNLTPDTPFRGQKSTGKSISGSQLQFITGLARKAGREPEAIAKELTGKSLDKCDTMEASNISKRLKA